MWWFFLHVAEKSASSTGVDGAVQCKQCGFNTGDEALHVFDPSCVLIERMCIKHTCCVEMKMQCVWLHPANSWLIIIAVFVSNIIVFNPLTLQSS